MSVCVRVCVCRGVEGMGVQGLDEVCYQLLTHQHHLLITPCLPLL